MENKKDDIESKVKKFANLLIGALSEDAICQEVDEAKPEFLSEGWEDEFDDEFEAYIEQGRGEAEEQVLNKITQGIVEGIASEYGLSYPPLREFTQGYVETTLKEQFSVLRS